MQYTTYLENCCLALAEAEEYSTDPYLISLVRLQHFVRKIAQDLPSHEPEPLWNPTAPVGMYVKSLEGELQRFRSSLPQEQQLSGRCRHLRTIDQNAYIRYDSTVSHALSQR
jgi:hypothetical protein